MIRVIRDGLVEKDLEEEAAKAARLEVDEVNKSTADQCRVDLSGLAPRKRRKEAAGPMEKFIQRAVSTKILIMVSRTRIFH